jgi:hypothetical protein
MSGDGPSKVAPGLRPQGEMALAEPLDEIILGDDDAGAAPPPVVPRVATVPPLGRMNQPDARSSPPAASVPPPTTRRDWGPNRAPADAEAGRDPKDTQMRKRAKLTLRIPDDEVSRPTLPAVTTPTGAVGVAPSVAFSGSAPRPAGPADPVSSGESATIAPVRPKQAVAPTPSADDTLEFRVDDVLSRLEAVETTTVSPSPPAAVGIDRSSDPGWTPFQPEVREALSHGGTAVEVGGEVYFDGRGTLLDIHEVDHSRGHPEEIPVDMDFSAIGATDSSSQLATRPRLPTPIDSEEIRFDENDRASETGEVEVEPEDLVSVESLPSPAQQPPAQQQPPPVKVGAKTPAFKAEGTPSATSLMASVHPASGAPAPPRPDARRP